MGSLVSLECRVLQTQLRQFKMRKEDEISFATGKTNVVKFKVVFLGDQGVGKSSVISRFIKNEFDETHNPTVGIDFISKNLSINDKTVRLQLWDTAGQERFRSLIPSYLKDCNAAFIVFDITSSNSFESINKWIDFVRDSRGTDTLIFVVGNKIDLEADRNVKTERAEAQMKTLGINYYEVSAKTGRNLNDMFKSLCSILMNVPVDRIIDTTEKPQAQRPISTQAPSTPINKQQTPVQSNQSTVLKNPNLSKGPERIKQKNCCE